MGLYVDNLLDECWAKARGLRMQVDLSVVDPNRILLLDLIRSIPEPHGQFFEGEDLAKVHKETNQIFNLLAGYNPDETDPIAMIAQTRDSGFINTLLGYAYDSSEDDTLEETIGLAELIQEEIKYTSSKMKKWMGNPFEPK